MSGTQKGLELIVIQIWTCRWDLTVGDFADESRSLKGLMNPDFRAGI